MFSYEFCENFKNTFLTEQLRITASASVVTRNRCCKKLQQVPRKLPLAEYYLNVTYWKLSDEYPARNLEHFSEQLFCRAPQTTAFCNMFFSSLVYVLPFVEPYVGTKILNGR